MYKAGMPNPPIPTVRSPLCKDQTKILSVLFSAAQSGRNLHQRRIRDSDSGIITRPKQPYIIRVNQAFSVVLPGTLKAQS